MPLFQCSDNEVKLLKRLRALEAADFSAVEVGLRPMAILAKIDRRLEPIERPLAALPPLSPVPGRV